MRDRPILDRAWRSVRLCELISLRDSECLTGETGMINIARVCLMSGAGAIMKTGAGPHRSSAVWTVLYRGTVQDGSLTSSRRALISGRWMHGSKLPIVRNVKC